MMWEWLSRSLSEIYRDFTSTRTVYVEHWHHTTNRPLTDRERRAVTEAFNKMAEAFETLDEAFGEDWR